MDCFLLLILYLVWKKLRVSPVLLLAFAFAALYWTQLALSAFGAFYRQIVSTLFVPAVYFPVTICWQYLSVFSAPFCFL